MNTFPTRRRTREKLSDGCLCADRAAFRPRGRRASPQAVLRGPGGGSPAAPRIVSAPSSHNICAPFLPRSPPPPFPSGFPPTPSSPPLDSRRPGSRSPIAACRARRPAPPRTSGPRRRPPARPPGGTRGPARPRGPGSGGRGRRRRGRRAPPRPGPAPPRPTLRPSPPLSRALPPSAAGGSALRPARASRAAEAPGPGRLRRLPPMGRRHPAPGRWLRADSQAGHKSPFAPAGRAGGRERGGGSPPLRSAARPAPPPPLPRSSSSSTPRRLAHPAGGKVPPSGRTEGQAGREGAAAGTRGRERGPPRPRPPTRLQLGGWRGGGRREAGGEPGCDPWGRVCGKGSRTGQAAWDPPHPGDS